MITILNTSILTSYGDFTYKRITLEEAQTLVRTNNYLSAVGHEATAEILTELLGMSVGVNRIFHTQGVGERAVVFKLRGRPAEGTILSREQIEAMGYDFGLLTRTA